MHRDCKRGEDRYSGSSRGCPHTLLDTKSRTHSRLSHFSSPHPTGKEKWEKSSVCHALCVQCVADFFVLWECIIISLSTYSLLIFLSFVWLLWFSLSGRSRIWERVHGSDIGMQSTNENVCGHAHLQPKDYPLLREIATDVRIILPQRERALLEIFNV